MSIGVRVAEHRRFLGLGQHGLAKLMSEAGFRWHQQTVARVELDQRPLRLDEGFELARIFGVTVSYLAGMPDPERQEADPLRRSLRVSAMSLRELADQMVEAAS